MSEDPAGEGARVGDAAADRIVPKPWGRERIWAHTDRYVGKVITIRAGQRLSLQKHRMKDEWILIQSGRLSLHHGADQGSMAVEVLGPGMQWHIPVGLIHRFEATDEDVELIEISTPELDDVVRLEDDYGREGTNAP
ncbi:MAG: cupin domain-containing protein [Chloroflexi bacterium]|nr:MAG: cupin domain-containing protein [Chloroflexota bacterium]